MGVATSEFGYTSAMPRKEDHEVHKDMWGHWGDISYTVGFSLSCLNDKGQPEARLTLRHIPGHGQGNEKNIRCDDNLRKV